MYNYRLNLDTRFTAEIRVEVPLLTKFCRYYLQL